MGFLSGLGQAAGGFLGELKETAGEVWSSATDAAPDFFSNVVERGKAEFGEWVSGGPAPSTPPVWSDTLWASRTTSPVIDPTRGNYPQTGLLTTPGVPAAQVSGTAQLGIMEIAVLAGVAALLVFAVVKFR